MRSCEVTAVYSPVLYCDFKNETKVCMMPVEISMLFLQVLTWFVIYFLGFCFGLFSSDRTLMILHGSLSHSVSLRCWRCLYLELMDITYICTHVFLQCFFSLLEYKRHKDRSSALSNQVHVPALTLSTSVPLPGLPHLSESLILPRSFMYFTTLLCFHSLEF